MSLQPAIALNLNFSYFPAYAEFLLQHKLRDMSVQQFRLSKELNLPLLKFFDNLTEEELIKLGMQSLEELLRCCAANQLDKYIESSAQKFINDQLPFITKNQLITEDIMLISLVRRRMFRHFITDFTTDLDSINNILDEVDVFTVKSESISIKTLFDIQQQMFKQAQSLLHIGNWQWNLKTKKLTWSDEVYNIYELQPQSEIASEKIALYNHPDDAGLIEKYIQWSIKTLLPHEFFYRIILKDNKQKIVHVKGEVKFNEEGLPVEMFGTLHDVTEQKEKEKQLEDSRKFIEKIADVSPCIITVLNVNADQYIFINKGVDLLLGYTAEEFMKNGRSFFYSLMPVNDARLVKEKTAQLKESKNNDTNEKIIDFTYCLQHKNGTHRWIHTFTTVFNRNSNGLVEDVLNISIDVTESYMLSQELLKRENTLSDYANRIEKHNEELIRMNNDLDSFTYMASHDLQEPLRKIKTFCNIILDKADETLSQENTTYFNRILSAASRMQTLIESLLYYSRATTAERILEPTDLNVTLLEVKKDLSEIIEAKNVTITSGTLPVLQVMPVQFHQLFLNMIENAIKYSRSNVDPVIKISASINKNLKAGALHTITFSDNGIGFEQQYADNIFKLFQRLHARNEYAGTGIGLAICKKIIENHKGTITATGIPGNGATFSITIPADSSA